MVEVSWLGRMRRRRSLWRTQRTQAYSSTRSDTPRRQTLKQHRKHPHLQTPAVQLLLHLLQHLHHTRRQHHTITHTRHTHTGLTGHNTQHSGLRHSGLRHSGLRHSGHHSGKHSSSSRQQHSTRLRPRGRVRHRAGHSLRGVLHHGIVHNITAMSSTRCATHSTYVQRRTRRRDDRRRDDRWLYLRCLTSSSSQ